MKKIDRSKLLQFHGKFTDLIPAGYKFWKAFANNYRTYRLDVVEHVDTIHVWQAHGGYVEFNDWFGMSKNVAEAVINGNFNWHVFKSAPECGYGFTIDHETKSIIPTLPTHDSFHFFCLGDSGKMPKDVAEAEAKRVGQRYRKCRLSVKMMAAIKDMTAKGWIKVS